MMAKQEEIRELTKNYLVGCIHGATVSYDDLSGYDKSTVEFLTDELLEEQSKLGAVIGVDREFPKHILPEAKDGGTALYNQGYLNGQVIMLEAGYVAVESLIPLVGRSGIIHAIEATK